jgi:hypothetical protein
MSVSKTKFKVLLHFVRFADPKLLSFGLHVRNSISVNAKFPNPIMSLDDLQSKLDSFQDVLADVIHRDRRVIARKNSLRHRRRRGGHRFEWL